MKSSSLLAVLILFFSFCGRGPQPGAEPASKALATLSDAEWTTLIAEITSNWEHPQSLINRSTILPVLSGRRTLVFLSAGNGKQPAEISFYEADDSGFALQEALTEINKSVPSPPRWLKLDLAGREKIVGLLANLEKISIGDAGLYGVTVRDGDGKLRAAYLPAQLLNGELIDERGILDVSLLRKDMRKGLEGEEKQRMRELTRDDKTLLKRFRTVSWFRNGQQVYPLYRTHRRDIDPTDTAFIEQSLRSAGRYLENAVADNGRFNYRFYPATGRLSTRYNILRHSGTIYAMLELAEYFDDSELISAAERAITYLTRQIHPFNSDNPDQLTVVEAGESKLGGNALAVLALAKYTEVTGSRTYLPLIQGLCRRICAIQAVSGEFTVHKVLWPSGEVSDFVSEYYPGEAIFALVRAYITEGSETWLDAAERAADWLITVRDRKRAPADHWLLYGLEALYRHRQKKSFLDHTRKIVDTICRQQRLEHRQPDWVGSYYSPPRSTSTAIRSEGLLAAWRLFDSSSDATVQGKCRAAVELGIRFQLANQLGPERVHYFPEPRAGLGGFSESLTNSRIRIDYVQHNVSAVLGWLQILKSATD